MNDTERLTQRVVSAEHEIRLREEGAQPGMLALPFAITGRK